MQKQAIEPKPMQSNARGIKTKTAHARMQLQYAQTTGTTSDVNMNN
jgi:hypothetical protein